MSAGGDTPPDDDNPWTVAADARAAWKAADAEVNRARTVEAASQQVAEAAVRDVETDVVEEARNALGRLGGATDDRRTALSYLREPVFEGGDTFSQFRSSTAIDSHVDGFVTALEEYVDGGATAWPSVISAFERLAGLPGGGPASKRHFAFDHLATLFSIAATAAMRHRDESIETLGDALIAAYASPVDPLTDLTEQPIALLPVRLETQFFTLNGGGTEEEDSPRTEELRIRVYPDQIHLDSHETELTAEEETWGKNFWATLWFAHHADPWWVDIEDPEGSYLREHVADERLRHLIADLAQETAGDEFSDPYYDPDPKWNPGSRISHEKLYDELKERVWNQLIDRFGQERAAYIVHALSPFGDSIGNNILIGPLSFKPQFGWAIVETEEEPDQNERNVAVRSQAAESTENNVNPEDIYIIYISQPYPYSADGQYATGGWGIQYQVIIHHWVNDIPKLEFPTVPLRPDSWTKPARTTMLPDRWVTALTWYDESGRLQEQRIPADQPIREPLAVSPTPEEQAAEAVNDGESGDDENRSAVDPWMTDFDVAEQVGMGLRINLGEWTDDGDFDGSAAGFPGFDPSRGFESVVVLGVKASLSAYETPDEFRALLDAHHYTDGLSLLEQGTATNSLNETARDAADDATNGFPVEVGSPLVNDMDRSDGDILARALAIGPDDSEAHVFAHVENADGTEQRDARHMNSTLWPATLGYNLSNLLLPNQLASLPSIWSEDDDPLSDDERRDAVGEALQWYDAYRRHFIRFVRGRGPFPALRVGRQPYGILPATTLDHGTDDEPELLIPTSVLDGILDGILTLREASAAVAATPNKFLNAASVESFLEGGADAGELYSQGADISTLLEGGVKATTLRDAGIPITELRAAGISLQEIDVDDADHADIDNQTDEESDATSGFIDRELDPLSELSSGLRRQGLDQSRLSSSTSVVEGVTRAESDLYGFSFDPAMSSVLSRIESLGNNKDVEDDEGDNASTDGDTEGIERSRTVAVDDALPERIDGFLRVLRQAWSESLEGADGLAGDDEQLDGDALIKTLKREALSSAVHLTGQYKSSENISSEQESGTDDHVHRIREELSTYDLTGFDPRSAYLQSVWNSDEIPYTIPYTEEERVVSTDELVDDDIDAFIDVLLEEDLDTVMRLNRRWSLSSAGGSLGKHFGYTDPDEWRSLTDHEQWLLLSADISKAPSAAKRLDQLYRTDAPPWMRLPAELYDRHDDFGFLWTLLRGLLHFGLTREYVDARLRLGYVYNDLPDEYVEPAAWELPHMDSPESYTNDPRTGPGTLYGDLFDPLPTNEPTGQRSLSDHPELSGGETYAEALRLAASDDSKMTSIDPRLSELTDSLAYLQDRDSADLSDLLLETLDLSSHRLDAWWTSLATKRLLELREVQGRWDWDDELLDWTVDNNGGDELIRAIVDPSLLWALNRNRVVGSVNRVREFVDADSSGRTVGGTENIPDASDETTFSTSDSANETTELGKVFVDATQFANLAATNSGLTVDRALSQMYLVPPPGLYVGAYGVVEELAKDEATETSEYIHMPSQQQATTAAILRSGYLANEKEGGEGPNLLAVDLSAERVRRARRILDGVRHGRPLGELLGYRFERRLHERTMATEADREVNLMQYKHAFRVKFPSVERSAENNAAKATVLAMINVVDGYELLQNWDDRWWTGDQYLPLPDELEFPELASKEAEQLDAIVSELSETVDAVSDLLIAEGIHQVGRGNFEAASSSLASLSSGAATPEPAFLETPRTETGVQHRQCLILDPTPADGGTTPRSAAEPALNAWLADMLPNIDTVGCRAEFRWTEADENEVIEAEKYERVFETSVTLDALGLAPLDLLVITREADGGGRSELESRLAYHLLRTRPTTVPNNATTAFRFTETPTDATVSVGEFLELLRSLRALVQNSRPLTGTDLAHPIDEADAGYDRTILDARKEAAYAGLQSVAGTLDDRLARFAPGRGDAETEATAGDSAPPAHDRIAPTTQIDSVAAGIEIFVKEVDFEAVGALLSDLDSAERLLDEFVTLAGAIPLIWDSPEQDEIIVDSTAEQEISGMLGEPLELPPTGPADSELELSAGTDGQTEEGNLLDIFETDRPYAIINLNATEASRFLDYVGVKDVKEVTPDHLERVIHDQERGQLDPRLFARTFTRASEQNVPDRDADEAEPELSVDVVDTATVLPGTTTLRIPEEILDMLRGSSFANISVEVVVRGVGPVDPFEKRKTVTSTEDGLFTASFDFGDLEHGTPFTVTALVDDTVTYAARGRVISDEDSTTDPAAIAGGLEMVERLVRLGSHFESLVTKATEPEDIDTPAATVHRVLETTDCWDAVRAAQQEMDPETQQVTEADVDAVDALVALSEADLPIVEQHIKAVLSVAEQTGLTSAFIAARGVEVSEAGRLWFAADDPAGLRARLQHVVENPAILSWVDSQRILTYAPDSATRIAALSQSGRIAEELDVLLGAPPWIVRYLGTVVEAPHAGLGDLSTWLHHPDTLSAEARTRFPDRLRALSDAVDDLPALDSVLKATTHDCTRETLATDLRTLAVVVEQSDTGDSDGLDEEMALPDAAVARQTFGQTWGEEINRAVSTFETERARITAATMGVSINDAFRRAVLEILRTALVDVSAYGVYGSTPDVAVSATKTVEAALIEQARAVDARAADRLAEYETVDRESIADGDRRTEVDADVDRLRTLFGEEFVCLPPFVAPNGSELRQTFGDTGLLPDDPLAPETFLQRIAQVRERPATFQEAYSYAEALSKQLLRELCVGQLPYRENDTWVGVDGADPTPGTVSFIASFGPDANPNGTEGSLAGLLIDEWVESVPSSEETTGLAVNFDDPGNRAPQTLLLATPPDDGQWTMPDLLSTVRETMDFAKLRALDLGDIEAFDFLLPMLYSPTREEMSHIGPSFRHDLLGRYRPNNQKTEK